MKKIIVLISVIIAVTGGMLFFREGEQQFPENSAVPSLAAGTPEPVSSHLDATYSIEGESVVLADGYSESGDPESMVSTVYFGNEAKGDLDGDGDEDVVFILTRNGGGTGVFFYAAVAVYTDGSYSGLNAVYLGDRIAPQSTEINDGIAVVNYADRRDDEPYSAKPTVGVTKYLQITGGKLIEITKQ